MRRWILIVGLLAALLLVAAQVFPDNRATLAEVPDKVVTLTFDDGPDPWFTPEILRILRDRKVPATFFVIGKNAVANPDLLKQIVDQGHVVANHTYNHPHLEELGKEQVYEELSTVDAALSDLLGPSPRLSSYFRPPRGNLSREILAAVKDMNKELVLWNVCVENRSTTTPEEVRERVMSLVKDQNGGILLAHDGELDRTLTVQSLPLILDDLIREGYRIVPLDEYLEIARSL